MNYKLIIVDRKSNKKVVVTATQGEVNEIIELYTSLNCFVVVSGKDS